MYNVLQKKADLT